MNTCTCILSYQGRDTKNSELHCWLYHTTSLVIWFWDSVSFKTVRFWSLRKCVSTINGNIWAKFHRVAKHKNSLSMKISSLIKTGLPTKFPFDAYCLLLVFSCRLLILKTTWKFSWKSCFYEGKHFMLSKFLC